MEGLDTQTTKSARPLSNSRGLACMHMAPLSCPTSPYTHFSINVVILLHQDTCLWLMLYSLSTSATESQQHLAFPFGNCTLTFKMLPMNCVAMIIPILETQTLKGHRVRFSMWLGTSTKRVLTELLPKSKYFWGQGKIGQLRLQSKDFWSAST